MDTEFEDNELPEEIVAEARRMGWVPQEKFKGNKDHWVDADEFVERGKTVMPILLQNNKRLQMELDKNKAEVDNLKTKLANSETVMAKLEKHYTEANKRAVENAKTQLREELKQAREDGDLDKELEVREKLDDIREREKEIEEPVESKEKKTEPSGNKLSPEFIAWKEENPWFDGPSKEDKKKTKLVTRIAEDLREEGSELSGVEFFDECVRVYEEQYGEVEEEEEEEKPRTRRPVSKVESSANRRPRRSGGKTFADLPADAKRACMEDVDDLVGPDKRYKTVDAWKAQYAKIYFTEE